MQRNILQGESGYDLAHSIISELVEPDCSQVTVQTGKPQVWRQRGGRGQYCVNIPLKDPSKVISRELSQTNRSLRAAGLATDRRPQAIRFYQASDPKEGWDIVERISDLVPPESILAMPAEHMPDHTQVQVRQYTEQAS